MLKICNKVKITDIIKNIKQDMKWKTRHEYSTLNSKNAKSLQSTLNIVIFVNVPQYPEYQLLETLCVSSSVFA